MLCFELSGGMGMCWLPVPDMYTDSGSNEMGCAAFLPDGAAHSCLGGSGEAAGSDFEPQPGQ